MQLGRWWSDLSKPSDTWCSLETAQLYLQQMDTTSEGRTSFPTTTFSSFFSPRFDYLLYRWSCITLLRNSQLSSSRKMVGILFTGFLRKNWFWIRARRQSGFSTNTLPWPCPGAVRCRQPWSDLCTGNRASNCSSETRHVCIMPSCPPGLAFCLHKIRYPQD